MTNEEKPSSAERAAEAWACENANEAMQAVAAYLGAGADMEALDSNRICEQAKLFRGFLAGAEWQAAQVAEAVAKLEEAKQLVAECCGSYFETGKPMFIDHEAKAKALAQLDAAIAPLKGTK